MSTQRRSTRPHAHTVAGLRDERTQRRARQSIVPPEVRARRRRARERRRLARLDVAIGAFVALLLLIVSPGLAITGLVALLMLAAVLTSLAISHRRARQRASRERNGGAGRADGAAGREPRAAERRSSGPARRAG